MVVPLTDIDADSEHVYVERFEDRIVPSFPLVRERLRIDEDHVRMIENLLVTDDDVIGLRAALLLRALHALPRESVRADQHDDGAPRLLRRVARRGARHHRHEAADAHTAKMLGTEVGAPLIVREVTYHDLDGVPVQTVFDRYRGDRVRLEGSTL